MRRCAKMCEDLARKFQMGYCTVQYHGDFNRLVCSDLNSKSLSTLDSNLVS